MRIARIFRGDDTTAFVQILQNEAVVLSDAPWHFGVPTGERIPIVSADELDLACPVTPTKIVCIGRNYAAHAKELGHEVPTEPLLFLKPPSALLEHGGTILLPPESTRVEHEAELGVVIGRVARNVPKEQALDYVFGYTVVGDITARDLQRKDGQWARAKGFDTFCPVGPWVETACDPSELRVVCKVNGEVKQDGTTASMIFDVPTLIAYVSRMMTLVPGDMIVTGTPEGVGPIVPGDEVDFEIVGAHPTATGVGRLSLHVAKSA